MEVDKGDEAELVSLIAGDAELVKQKRVIDKTAEFSLMPIEKRNDLIGDLNSGDIKLDDVDMYASLTKANNDIQRMAEKDAMTIGIKQGIITDFTPLEAMDYRMFCEKIEEIGKILREFNISEGVREYYIEIRQYFNEVMNAYLKRDLTLAHKAWLKKDEIVDIAKLLIDNSNYEDKIKIKDLIRIAENCKDMAAFI